MEIPSPQDGLAPLGAWCNVQGKHATRVSERSLDPRFPTYQYKTDTGDTFILIGSDNAFWSALDVGPVELCECCHKPEDLELTYITKQGNTIKFCKSCVNNGRHLQIVADDRRRPVL